MHRASLDLLAETGLPVQVTEMDIDGVARGDIPGDEVQLADYRRIFPTFWEHRAVEGITMWGWRVPTHWRRAHGAPVVLENGTHKFAMDWLMAYVKRIAPVITPGQSFTIDNGVLNRVGTVVATDWASARGRVDLRTFDWQVVGGSGQSIFAIDGRTGEISLAQPLLLDPRNSSYTLSVRVNDGFHTSADVEVAVTIPATVTVCHRGSENVIAVTGLRGHLGHGDAVGSCGAGS